MTIEPETPVHRSPRLVRFVFGRNSEYVWELRYQFLICLFLFVFSLVMGLYFGEKISGTLMEELENRFPMPEDLNLPIPMLFLFYFFLIAINNLLIAFFGILLGIAFSIPPLLIVVLNGFVIGGVSHNFLKSNGIAFTVVSLTPHGIIEIPTILLSMAVGMRIGYQLINSLRHRGSLRSELAKALRLFLWRIVPLILLAAVIEITITPLLLILLGLVPMPTI